MPPSKDLQRPGHSRNILPERMLKPLLVVFVLGAVMILAPMLWLQLLRSSKVVYDEMRGSPAVALATGQRIYQGTQVTGPLFSVVYAPFTYVIYTPMVLLKKPQAALLMGSSIALVFYTSPLIYILLRFRKEPRRRSVS